MLVADELKRENARIGYTDKTRTYLRRRSARVLRRLGELNDPAFLPMALGVLLTFSDADAIKPREFSVMDWDSERRQTFFVDAYLVYWAFAFLLYRNSPRYEQKKKGGWRCQPNYRPGRPAPMAREEAFPEIWDAAPDALFHLLEKSRCAPVHEFAAKALGQNRSYCAELELEGLRTLLAASYEPTWQLGSRLAGERWSREPSAQLLLAVLASPGEGARAQGLSWLAADPSYYSSPGVAAALLLSPFPAVRRTLIDCWRVAPPAQTAEAPQLLREVFERLLSLEAESENAGERAADAASAILIGFQAHLPALDTELLGRLLGHPLVEVQQLGGRIVAEYLPIQRITGELVAGLLAAESPLVRAQGVAVLGRLPLAEMPDAEEVLLAFCVAKESEIRQAARLPVRNLQKIRDYKETRLQLDPGGLSVQSSGDEEYREVKIDLPESWVRGFLQVSSAMTLDAKRVVLHPMDLWNLCFTLRRRREKEGPRSLRFVLEPGEPVRILVDPWRTEIRCPRSIYQGAAGDDGQGTEIRLWGRRRLFLLERLLPIARSVTLHLLGTGMPSFFVADLGELTFTLGLSGWTRNDWSRLGQFDLLAPRAHADAFIRKAVFDTLRARYSARAEELAAHLGLERKIVLGALAAGAQSGQVLYDLHEGVYRYRELSREPLPIDRLRFSNERELEAQRLLPGLSPGSSRVTSGVRVIEGKVPDGRKEYRVQLTLDRDERLVAGSCNCSFYIRNRLHQGPCEHMLALRLVQPLDRLGVRA